MNEHTFFGWTLSQWAEAAAYSARFDLSAPRTVAGAHAVRHCWYQHRVDAPGGLRLIDAEPVTDFAWATAMMVVAVEELASLHPSSWR